MRYQLTALGREWHRPEGRWPGGDPLIPLPDATPGLERILLPLDLTKCPVEAFRLVNRVAERGEVTVVLLHVLHLNIPVPENRVYNELGHEARYALAWLARQHIHPNAHALLRVRLGDPAEQILATSKAENVGLIVLSTSGPSFWSRCFSFGKPASARPLSRLARKIVYQAPCSVIVLPNDRAGKPSPARLPSPQRAPLPAVAGV